MAVQSASDPAGFDPFELTDTVLGDIRDPYPLFAEMRAKGAVHAGPIPVPGAYVGQDDHAVFVAYGYDEVMHVLRDNEHFSSSVYGDIMGIVMGRTILEMDEPEHKLQRALVAPAFRQKMLARWESELVEAVVDDLLDRIAARGRSDLVRDLTFAFPAQVIARILGLPRTDYARFQRWSLELISVAANWDRGIAASAALRDYFAEVLAERRKAPSDDLISDLAVAEVDGEVLSDEEIFGFLRLLLPAGVETTYRSSGNLLFALLTHPDQLDAVRRDRALVPTAIEEALRWEPPLTSIVRRAKKDCTLAGVDIGAGADVGVCLASANRDERRFTEPDRFNIFREPRPHASFGSGPHMCIGMHLARMETRVALNRVLDRLDDLRLDPDGDDVHIHGMAFRSPTSLPVLFTAA